MNKKFYIAYGSNLSVEQMAIRAPDAELAGTAILKDMRLIFKTHATVEPCKGYEKFKFNKNILYKALKSSII